MAEKEVPCPWKVFLSPFFFELSPSLPLSLLFSVLVLVWLSLLPSLSFSSLLSRFVYVGTVE